MIVVDDCKRIAVYHFALIACKLLYWSVETHARKLSAAVRDKDVPYK
jgi:hypothetical protein